MTGKTTQLFHTLNPTEIVFEVVAFLDGDGKLSVETFKDDWSDGSCMSTDDFTATLDEKGAQYEIVKITID